MFDGDSCSFLLCMPGAVSLCVFVVTGFPLDGGSSSGSRINRTLVLCKFCLVLNFDGMCDGLQSQTESGRQQF